LSTGKAFFTRIAEHSPVMWARTAEEAADCQPQHIHNQLAGETRNWKSLQQRGAPAAFCSTLFFE
jgi:hypothetical protein